MKKGKPRNRLWLLLSAVALVIGGTDLPFRPGQSRIKSRDISTYTITAKSGKLPGLITASGELKAKRSVNVSPDKQGLLEELYVDEGDRVVKG